MLRPQPKPKLALVRSPTEVDPPSDATLVERARGGDRSAEEALYVRHLAHIQALCLRLLGNTQEAEDVTHDAFVDLLEQLATLRDPGSLRAWLVRVAIHKVHRRFRRRKLLRALGLEHSAYNPEWALRPRPHVASEHLLALRGVASALAQLPDATRAAWLLRYVEGHQLEQVAALTGCSLATVKRRLAEASRVVREYTDFEEDDHG